MPPTTLEQVAHAVVRLAQRHGFVRPRDIRTELKLAGLDEQLWKEVVALAKNALNYRQGRYYHLEAVSPRLQQRQEHQREVQRIIKQILKEHRDAAKKTERRGAPRVEFILPVKVHTEDGKAFALLSRDLSASGIRLLGTKRLLGQRIRVDLPLNEAPPYQLLVRVLWTCAIGDDLFENGGSFLEIVS